MLRSQILPEDELNKSPLKNSSPAISELGPSGHHKQVSARLRGISGGSGRLVVEQPACQVSSPTIKKRDVLRIGCSSNLCTDILSG